MGFPRVLGVVGLVGLSGCSLLVDTSDLGRGGPVVLDATADRADEARADASSGAEAAIGLDASTDRAAEFASDAAVGLDSPGDGEADATRLDAARDAGVVVTPIDGSVDAAPVDAAPVDAAPVDAAPVDAGVEASPIDAAADVTPIEAGPGTLSVGLVAYYPFDETSGTLAADGSGNGHTATMRGATFTPGLNGNAATMDGSGRYVSLPSGIVVGLTSCSISMWTNLVVSSSLIHIVDWGTGLTTYMSLTSAQFAITVNSMPAEERVRTPTVPRGGWHHVAFTLGGGVGTIYIDGVQTGQSSSMTLTPSSLGTTTQNWLGRSQDPADPFLTGQIDEFRLYGRALTAAEVHQLFQLQL